jgi:hypothetical protein
MLENTGLDITRFENFDDNQNTYEPKDEKDLKIKPFYEKHINIYD